MDIEEALSIHFPNPSAGLSDRKCQREGSEFSSRDDPIQQDTASRKMALDVYRLVYSTHSLSTELFPSKDEINVVFQVG